MILPNRNGLKSVSDFAIDAQFIQAHASKIFQYSGEETEEYRALVAELQKVVSEAMNSLQSIQSLVSVIH